MDRPTPTPYSNSNSTLHGFLVIDKPAGWTSHDVVGRLRRLLGERQVGHAGTLDPAATGVLPVAVGAATRVLEYLADASKSYVAEVTFGVATDSYDADGRVVAVADPSTLDAPTVERALADFLGQQDQLPPMHSAIKVGGRRLYEAARRGEEVVRAPRRVTFHSLDLIRWDPPIASVFVDCSKGTYVRSLAHDLGQRLGVPAHLSDLVRVRSGPFHLCEAWTLPELAELADLDLASLWPEIAVHPDIAVEAWPALLLGDADRLAWGQGKRIAPASDAGTATPDAPVRAYDPAGDWLGVGADDAGRRWRPTKVVMGTA